MNEEQVVTLKGKTREEKVTIALRIKAEFEDKLPEMAELRRQLIDAGMMEPGFGGIASVKTDAIDYNVSRDYPARYDELHRKEPYITEEIKRDIQARKNRQAGTAIVVRDSRGGVRRR